MKLINPPSEYYLAIFEAITKMDKLYQFFILLAILLLGLFIDFQNAEAIQENTVTIQKHSDQLIELNQKFNGLVTLASNISTKNDTQDEEIEKLKKKNEEQDEKIKEQDEKIKEHDEKIKDDEKIKEQQGTG